MTIEEMKAKKTELGYTNEKIAELSTVPLGTVQKIFAGETKSPRYDTIQKLIKVFGASLSVQEYSYKPDDAAAFSVAEYAATYGADYYNHRKKAEKATKKIHNADYSPVPIENRLGVAAGKYKVPDDIDFCNEEIWKDFSESDL